MPGGKLTSNRWEYPINGEVNFGINGVILAEKEAVIDLLNSPVNHFKFPSTVGQIKINSCAPGNPITTPAKEIL